MTFTLNLELQAHVLVWVRSYTLVILCDHIFPEPYKLWTWNLYCWTRQGHAKAFYLLEQVTTNSEASKTVK